MAFFRGGRRARWDAKGYIFGLPEARKQLERGAWPIGQNDDKSIVWQDHQRNEYDDHHYARSEDRFAFGDYLIYGVSRLSMPIGFLSYLLLCWAIPNYIWQGDSAWIKQSAHISLGLAIIGFYYCFLSRYNRFVIFDRRNRLVHISHYFGRRFHSVSWEDFDYLVLDHHVSSFGMTHSADILTAPPPWSLEHKGLPLSFPFISIVIETSKESHTTNRTPRYKIEEKVEFIIDFMTRDRSHPQIFNVTREMDKMLTRSAKDDFRRFRRRTLRSYALADPEKLPDKPNWKKDELGNWEKLHQGTIARAGLLGLWGITHTLPPHLRGTRADPAHRNDTDAPRPGMRWYSHENGGTGELADQPDEVIEAVLAEGMGALERFPEAAQRARKAREEAVMHHNRNGSWVISPDA
ncbi:MAG: hypothetical protein LAT61_11055 [Alcanivorax sp.]|nr:hypothetical protein [Alcanivorax sp.]